MNADAGVIEIAMTPIHAVAAAAVDAALVPIHAAAAAVVRAAFSGWLR